MKKRQVVLYVVVMLVLLTTSVFATIQAELNVTATADDNTYYPGEEFIVTISLKNLTTTQGIKSIEGYIDINSDVLEPLTVDSIVKGTDGKVQIGTNSLDVYDASNIPTTTDKGIIFNTNPVSQKGNYRLVINLENPVSSDTDLVKIKFKIKDNVEPATYQSVMVYKLFNIFATDAGEKLQLDQKSYRLTVSRRPESGNTANNTSNENAANNTPTNSPTNNTVNNTVNNTARNNTVNNTARNNAVNNAAKNNTVNNAAKNNAGKNNAVNNAGQKVANKPDNTTSPTNLPKTGYRLILIPIVALAIVGFVFYKKYSKYANYHE